MTGKDLYGMYCRAMGLANENWQKKWDELFVQEQRRWEALAKMVVYEVEHDRASKDA